MTARKRVLLLTTAAAASLLPAAVARGQLAFTPCEPDGIECATVAVPVDRSGAVPGTIDLAVYRAPARGPSRGVLLGLPGGPGDGGLAYFRRRLAAFDEARATHDLVFLDPRGAGRSRPLRCDDAVTCARELGPASRFFTSRDVADDAEAVRAALGAERIALYGISYGGWYAQTYARRYPDRVAALVLDAPVTEATVEDPFDRGIYAGLPAALRALCDGGACRAVTRDPYADAAAVIRRMRSTELIRFVDAALTYDVNPAVRAELPAALAARRRGDRAPLARLVAGALLQPPADRERSNQGANVVTQCEERALPWERGTSEDQRLPEAQRRVAAIPPAAFAPFDPSFALFGGIVPQCLAWTPGPESPLVGGPLPRVPTLVLTGKADIRVPPAGVARDLGSTGRLLHVGHVGHGVLGEDPTGCASRAVAALLAGAPIAECAAAGLAPRPPFARRLRDVGVVDAAVLTATDAINQAAMRIDALRRTATSVRFAGLRGGSARGNEERVTLDRAQWVRGLRVSGTARADGRHDLRLGGAARGVLRVRGTRYTGRIDGARVRGRLRPRDVGAAGAPVGSML